MKPPLRTRVLAYHKPAGVLVTHDDELNRPTVYDNLPDDDGARWHAVGRLDADTTGLLLLTNDGKLVQHVTDPVANTDGVVKEYRVRCGTTIDDAALAQLRSGVELSGGLGSTQPADVELDDEPRQLRVRIREGKNRQVRRMIQAVGSSVLQLHRERVGELSLGELGLEEGAWRALSDDEVESALGYACRALDAPAPDGYALLDSGDGRRLETFGRFTLVRACPSATWPRGLPAARWAEADVAYDGDAWSGRRLAEVEAASAGAGADADADGGGAVDWTLANDRAGVRLALDLGANGQIGVFPEQWKNWDWLRRECARRDGDAPPRVLNLFSYTGGSTLACAAGGAAVTHLDGARSAVSRARRNARLAGLGDAPVRWIADDALTFVERAVRRGEVYDGIVADPPAFGRGGGKKEWRIDKSLPKLLALLPALLADPPAFVLLSCHDQKWPRERLEEALSDALPAARRGGRWESGAMTLRAGEGGGRDLPMGCFARWSEYK